jgi:hypothetical protein
MLGGGGGGEGGGVHMHRKFVLIYLKKILYIIFEIVLKSENLK